MKKDIHSGDVFKVTAFILFVVSVFIASYYYEIHQKVSVEMIKNFIIEMGFWGPVVYFILYAITSIVFFPASLLSTASGAVWGVYLGTFYTVVAATVSAIIPFIVARVLGRSFVRKMMHGTKMDICDLFLSRNGFISILVIRLVPLFPWDMVNYGSGICGIRFKDYLLATLIGIIPASFTYNLIGSSLGQPLDIGKVVLIFVLVAVLGISSYFLKRR